MSWKPHTEQPDHSPQSMLLAVLDEGEYYLLNGLYTWNGVDFRHDETDRRPRPSVFWWIAESEVLEGLPTGWPK